MKKIRTCISQIAFLFVFCFMASVANAAPIELKAATPLNATTFIYKAFEEMAKFIETESKGKYKLVIYESAKLGNPDTVMQGIQFGTIHFSHEGTSNVSAFTPLYNIFDLPFVFRKDGDFEKVFYSPLGEEIRKRGSSRTIRYLGFTRCDFRKMYTKTEVKSLADLQKLRIRTTLSKIHTNAVNSFGTTALVMTGMELFTGLQQGVVDGFDIDLVFAHLMNFYSATSYVFETDHIYSPQTLNTGERWWSSLSAEDQELFEKAAEVYIAKANEGYAQELASTRQFQMESGIKFTTPSQNDKDRMLELSAPLYKGLTDEQTKLLNEIQQLLGY